MHLLVVMGYNTYFTGVFTTDREIPSTMFQKCKEEYGWQVGDDKKSLFCDGGKMLDYHSDIFNMAVYFLEEGYVLTGTVKWQGEEVGDTGKIELSAESMKETVVDLELEKFKTTVKSLKKRCRSEDEPEDDGLESQKP